MNALLGLVSGQILSDSADLTKDQVKKRAKRIELIKNLDDYDQRFKEKNELDIDRYKTDMEAVIKKRERLVSFAEDCLDRGSISVKSNSKDEFISFACSEIGDDSIVVEKYLSGFYDLVFQNRVKLIPNDLKAIATYLADLMSDIDKEYSDKYDELNRFVKLLSERIEELKNCEIEGMQPVEFSSFYKGVKKRFTTEKTDVFKNLVGSVSDAESYIEENIKVEKEDVPVLSFLDNWFSKTENGAILIYGEPGHGKSLLCDKAVVDFCQGEFLEGKASNVLAVSLNTGHNRTIINNKEVELENALVWKANKKQKFSFEDCQGALLFLDGFDEFIDEAKRADTNIKNIYDFMENVKDIAVNNDIHIVVLSRTVAVYDYLKVLSEVCYSFELSPISKEQQDKWLDEHNEYGDYKEDLRTLQNNEDMRKLLGVPLLFRLIVHNRFKNVSSNVVELYDNLFATLLRNRHITEHIKIQLISEKLMELAYRVYCTNTHTANYYKSKLVNDSNDNKDEPDYSLLLSFYVSVYNDRKIGFSHRTFYQYYLAKYIYSTIIKATDENVEYAIGLLAERELDETVRQYLILLRKNEDETTIHANLEKMVEALSRTEAHLNLRPQIESGDADKSRILRSQNIYRNIFYFVAIFSHIIKSPIKGKLDIMIRKYRSEGIVLLSEGDKRADLKGACLAGAYLKNAKLIGADLTNADLRGADLRGVQLTKAFLNIAKLIQANLREALLSDAKMIEATLDGAYLKFAVLRGTDLTQASMRAIDLTGADLTGAIMNNARMRGADLTGADLTGAKLNHTFLRGADLRGAKLIGTEMDGAYLRGADLSGAIITDVVDLNKAVFYGAKIDIRYKELIDSSAEGYESITWVSYENTGKYGVIIKSDVQSTDSDYM